MRGYFGIGIHNTKTPQNIGTLWRSANLYGAAFVYTVGARYQRQCTDTMATPEHVPLFAFDTVDDLHKHLPHGCRLVGVELDPRARPLSRFTHPQQACYLLGSEDNGLPAHVVDRCHDLIQVETLRPQSLNVAVAGSLVLHARHVSRTREGAPA
jgi:tRNA G18 (ribose-2'-O)-methylase SpoU